MEKRKVKETLLNMAVGQIEKFPIEQASSLNNTIYGSNLAKERADGLRWKKELDYLNQVVVVERTQ